MLLVQLLQILVIGAICARPLIGVTPCSSILATCAQLIAGLLPLVDLEDHELLLCTARETGVKRRTRDSPNLVGWPLDRRTERVHRVRQPRRGDGGDCSIDVRKFVLCCADWARQHLQVCNQPGSGR